MAEALNTKASQDLIKSAVTNLGNRALAEKVSAPVNAVFELARQTTAASSGNKRSAVITSVKVTVRDSSDGAESPPMSTVFNTRQPIDSGPKRRVPIRTGGGTCFTVVVGKVSVTICIEWES
jgi:hypothetical protein